MVWTPGQFLDSWRELEAEGRRRGIKSNPGLPTGHMCFGLGEEVLGWGGKYPVWKLNFHPGEVGLFLRLSGELNQSFQENVLVTKEVKI